MTGLPRHRRLLHDVRSSASARPIALRTLWARSIELMIASSVASATARNRGVIRSFGNSETALTAARRLRERPANDAFADLRHGKRIRQQDRCFDFAELLHLYAAHEFAEAVADHDGGGNLLLKEIAAMGRDGRHAGAHALAFDERAMSDAHTGDVRDRAERAGFMDANRDAQIAQSRARLSAACAALTDAREEISAARSRCADRIEGASFFEERLHGGICRASL